MSSKLRKKKEEQYAVGDVVVVVAEGACYVEVCSSFLHLSFLYII